MDWDDSKTWYHGSPLVLTCLRPGSTITQDRELARVFSHKPALVSQWTDAQQRRHIKHTGTQPGYLYRVAERVAPEDVYLHPRTAMEPGQEWLTRRALRVELVERTQPRAQELLSAAEIAALRQRARTSAE